MKRHTWAHRRDLFSITALSAALASGCGDDAYVPPIGDAGDAAMDAATDPSASADASTSVRPSATPTLTSAADGGTDSGSPEPSASVTPTAAPTESAVPSTTVAPSATTAPIPSASVAPDGGPGEPDGAVPTSTVDVDGAVPSATEWVDSAVPSATEWVDSAVPPATEWVDSAVPSATATDGVDGAMPLPTIEWDAGDAAPDGATEDGGVLPDGAVAVDGAVATDGAVTDDGGSIPSTDSGVPAEPFLVSVNEGAGSTGATTVKVYTALEQFNLVSDPHFVNDFADWNVVNGGNGWGLGGGFFGKFAIGSYSLGTFSQVVDLTQAISENDLDSAAVPLTIGSYCRRASWGNDYVRVQAEFLDGSGGTLSASTLFEADVSNDVSAFCGSTVTSYPVGTRQVRVSYSTHDGEFWAGQYAAIFQAPLVLPGSYQIRIAVDNGSYGTWLPYSPVVDAVLAGTGMHTVSVQIGDAESNVLDTQTDTIELEPIGTDVSSSSLFALNEGALTTTSTSVQVYSVPEAGNAITDGHFDDDFDAWTVQNGGNGWALGTGPFARFAIGSYLDGTFSQIVDLTEFVSPTDLDGGDIPLTVGSFCRRGGHAPDSVTISVEYLDETDSVLSSATLFNAVINNGSDAFCGATIESYPAGTRHLRVTYGTRDGEFWAGQYAGIFEIPVVLPGAWQMRVSVDGAAYGPWEPYSAVKDITIGADLGAHPVTVQLVNDYLGLVSTHTSSIELVEPL